MESRVENMTEAALQIPAPGIAIGVVVTVMTLLIVSLSAHALGMARGRRMERMLESTRSSLEAAVHGVPDRRRRGQPAVGAGASPGQPGMPSSAMISVCSAASAKGLFSSRLAA
ncbi:hypothetical protein [Plastoroseomonas hellenica]|uniref:hypothetical protein n=1 Tax=Plastoroseomonas hellenica TaxID=2687306 RepID=UPI001BAD33EA|nr:hypothetical protein [Plastoroseomonas hellenica]MBR0647859.1 hypothetical protein [Plastoroseomonas hellenica]